MSAILACLALKHCTVLGISELVTVHTEMCSKALTVQSVGPCSPSLQILPELLQPLSDLGLDDLVLVLSAIAFSSKVKDRAVITYWSAPRS